MTAVGGDGVERLLVTGEFTAVQPIWLGTAAYANWIKSRDHPGSEKRKTWLLTLFTEDLDRFLGVAQACGGATVEEIIGAGEEETYRLRLGEEGTGWPGR